jgi:predicted lipoprotein with Yx(FWY)xxD motif
MPPVLVNGTPTAEKNSGVDASKLGTIKRSDGTTQVTYSGHPLYIYGSGQPKTTSGERKTSAGGVFGVVSLAGTPIYGKKPPKHHATPVVISSKGTHYGRVLTTNGHRALYVRSFDATTGPKLPLQSTCSYSSKCAVAWPPLVAPTSTGPFNAGRGVQKSHLGTVGRTNATGQKVWQVTYYGHPLYEFVKDTRPHATSGENVAAFDAMWYLDMTNGIPVAPVRAGVRLEDVKGNPVLAVRTSFGTYRSLYQLTYDQTRNSTCKDQCAGLWPPLLSQQQPIAGYHVKSSGLGLIRRSDGTQQVTYFGHPVYMFAYDLGAAAASGLANGEYYVDEQAHGVWYLTAPDATPYAGSLSIDKMSSSMGSILAVNPPSSYASRPFAVYAYSSDTSTKSTCTGTCARFWPPVLVSGTPTAAKNSGVDGSKLGTIKRADGTVQATYYGHPLYFFAFGQPNGTNGEGKTVGSGKFQVVSLTGTPK